ncbi:lipid IV(A) 4-amino-4-deoxy-L-arabinosyltransferase [Brenneria izadpanahii]|uniref:Undecaprenyl phosphate-alpha-4-amino-4-deoxy-L-arabinose arabinosyl transferase n=1 Tax=Brenneria izadpanahii TaxID=2722756 RepID=A0ABX7UVF1_9GAMM|nr:lipid IV(A) 4-amino-4-deoxy-L-arabinosyltransferase [Brenneria izadpanahii]QTF09713.1 lipid IV(A) 4-amino-4-deoxy-L-arabinosyltransferase [Brenneria izadpanahii]
MTTTGKGFLLLALLILYYLVPLEFRSLWQPDETRYAEISREMLQNGNWVTPRFFDLRYFEKPVAGYWINNVGQWLFGHNNFAVRIGSVFSTILSALLVYWLGRRVYADRAVALTAVVMMLTSLLVYGVGTYSVLDPMLLLWLTAAMCSYWFAAGAAGVKQRVAGYLLLGLACGMGFMTKGFLALAVPVLVIAPWAIWRRRFRELLVYGPLAVLSAALLSAPWALAVHLQQPDFWRYFFWVEHIQRFAESDAQHKAPFWYYLPVLLVGALPWLALLPGALYQGWRQRADSPGGLYLFCWTIVPFLFFSIAKGKLPTYILPCFAPLAILMARHGLMLARKASNILKINAWINLLFGCVGMAALLAALAPWGIGGRSLYRQHEMIPLALAVVSFAGWALAGALSLKPQRGRWLAAALCPLALALCVGAAIPESVRNTKQPQSFVGGIAGQLADSRYILSNNPGIASAIAWTLQRSDMLFYDKQGELKYGLSYPDAQSRYVDSADFHRWLAAHRKQGTVSLVLQMDRGEPMPAGLPPADIISRADQMLFLQYRAAP